MRVVEPFKVSDDTLVSSTSPSVEKSVASRLEYPFVAVKNQYEDYSYSGVMYDVEHFPVDGYSENCLLSVNNGENVYYHNEAISSSNVTFVVRLTQTLFTVSGADLRSVAYYDNHVYVANYNGTTSTIIQKYTLDGTFVSNIVTLSGGTARICAHDGGIVVFNGLTGSSAECSYYIDGDLALTFDVHGVTQQMSSLASSGNYIYFTASDQKIHRFQALVDSTSPDITYTSLTSFTTTDPLPICINQQNSKWFVADHNNLRLFRLYIEGSNFKFEDAWRAGDVCAYKNKLYLCITNNTRKVPSVSVASDNPEWQEFGTTNRYNMFNDEQQSQTQRDTSIAVTLNFDSDFDTIALFNIEGTNVNVSHGAINNNYDITGKTKLVVSDFSGSSSTNLIITITNSGSVAKCGKLIVGEAFVIGESAYPTALRLQDYSRKETDDFGNITIIKRPNSKTIDYTVAITESNADAIYDKLSGLTTTPCLYVDDDDRYPVFAYYEDMPLIISQPNINLVSLKVQELV